MTIIMTLMDLVNVFQRFPGHRFNPICRKWQRCQIRQMPMFPGPVDRPHPPGAHVVPAFQPGSCFDNAEKRYPGRYQQVCDRTGTEPLTCLHFIDKDFMITKLWLSFNEIKKITDIKSSQILCRASYWQATPRYRPG